MKLDVQPWDVQGIVREKEGERERDKKKQERTSGQWAKTTYESTKERAKNKRKNDGGKDRNWLKSARAHAIAPSRSLVVRFLCTEAMVPPPAAPIWAAFSAPMERDLRGGASTVSAPSPSPAAPCAPAALIARRTCGHTNWSRYSVLSLVMVFLNSPLVEDSPAWNEKDVQEWVGQGAKGGKHRKEGSGGNGVIWRGRRKKKTNLR